MSRTLDNSTTTGLIAALKDYRSDRGTIYDDFIKRYLSWHLQVQSDSGSIPQHERIGIHRYLTGYVCDAFDLLHTERQEPYHFWRREFQKIDGREPPDLITVGYDNIRRTLVVMYIARLLENVTQQKWIVAEFEKYFFAQDHVLQQLTDVFVREVYRKGLRKLTVETEWSGYSAKIGSTELRCFETAGRIIFTLARKSLGRNEKSVTLIGDASEENGVSFGIQSVHTDFFTACSLIRDVADNWPKNSERQRRLVKRNDNISVQ